MPDQQELYWWGALHVSTPGNVSMGDRMLDPAFGQRQGCLRDVGTPAASEAIAVLLATGFYSGWGGPGIGLSLWPGQGRVGAPAQNITAGRGSRLVYISLAVICINLLWSEPGLPHGQAGRMGVRLDWGVPLLWEPPQPSPASPAAPGTACFCQAPPSLQHCAAVPLFSHFCKCAKRC